MLSMYCKFKAMRANRDQGVTAVEYGLILAAIVVLIGALVFTLGDKVQAFFTDANNAVTKK